VLVHPTAVIHPGAKLDPTVEVGAYATVGDRVRIGPHTTIGAHAVLEGPTEIGARNRIFPGAAIGLEPQDLKYRGEASWVRIGDDNVFREYVTINRATGEGEATQIGDRNLLMANVHVAHNCQIGNSVVMANAVSLAGHVTIEDYATIGGMVGVHQFVHIGSLSMVGGMSALRRDAPPYMTVEGNPARVRALNLLGLRRRGLERELSDLKKAFRLLYRSSGSLSEAIAQLDRFPSASVRHLAQFLQASLDPERRGPSPGSRHGS